MALQGFVIYLKCIVLFGVFSLSWSLTLPNMVTVKPRHTKFSSQSPPPSKGALGTPATSAPTVAKPGVAEYRVKDRKGKTCILLRTDALVEVSFKTNVEDVKGDSYVPDSPLIDGDCQNEDQAFMSLSWTGYALVWRFAKTPGGERWYVSRLELTVNTELPQYHGIKMTGNNIKLIHGSMVLPTPVGKSYTCDQEVVIDLVPEYEEDAPSGLNGKLFLRELQLQPFMYKSSDFGPAYKCSTQKGFRDETAPIAVGSILAIAVLITVAGYAVWRYFKIKKVQYNTME